MSDLQPLDLRSVRAQKKKIYTKIDHLNDFDAIVVKVLSASSPSIIAAVGKRNSGRIPIKASKLKLTI